MTARILITLLLCFASQAALAQPDAPALRRGVNASSWLGNAPRQPMFDRDFAQMRQVGFDHIRLPVNPELMGFKLAPGSTGMAAADFRPVDRAIVMAARHHLAVILDIHPEDDFVKTVQDNLWAQQEFVEMWQALARRYKDYPPGELAFGLLNEPQYYRQEDRYNAFARRLVRAIRDIDSRHTLVIGAPDGSSIEGLQKLDAIDDPHIVYDVHFYEPYIITAQGYHTGFEGTMVRYFRDVPYPSRLVDHNAEYYARSAPDPQQAQRELDEYTGAPWNAQHIARRIALIAAWAKAHKARVICGEFGVLRNYINPQSRYRWIADARTALEAGGIGWDIYDYTDIFGITKLIGRTTRPDPVDGGILLADPQNGSRLIEPAAIAALGLTP